MKLSKIIDSLNKIGAKHAVGIGHVLEDRVIGLKVRGIYEAPAAETIINAHKALERYTSTMRSNRFKDQVDEEWSYLCYGGLWFEPLMDELNAFLNKSNDKVTGTVTMRLYRGQAEAVAIETPNTIFDEKLATFMKDDNFNQNASAGFIEHYTLQMKLAQNREYRALVAIGGEAEKAKLIPHIRTLYDIGYKLYATETTHEVLVKEGIEAVLVHKISQPELTPNLQELLEAKRFDLIINIPANPNKPSDKKQEMTDGQVIRELAIKTHTELVTDSSVAINLINRIKKARV